ncbi:hypothetical protein AB4Z09_12495 [Rhodococcus sp. TAF43]|uniref:hypothetical protein n=1 Tax=unclassified Rhodococcus (in: high G+C Gram-positive bacteria) TaxID=192944 RepID=UPI000E0BC076|nr:MULTISPECIES: hypothetical protein [unclassified Rhodococcus (in: high G+C Gram-positive bacteria)]QKT13262.1 hypothetical protein HUN07_23270 [Rhodococcus sp. W8901]RDI19005.1 hypothetical protein DEU38_119103 [Rhodococcus sp. AG1013]
MNNELADPATAAIAKGDVVFIGSSAALEDARTLAGALGHRRADTVDSSIDCAVVDDDVLDGICTATQAALLVQVRALDVPVLTVHDARTRFRIAAGVLSPT